MKNNGPIPEVLPILSLKETILYPTMTVMLEIDQEADLHMLDAIWDGQRLLVAVAQKTSDETIAPQDALFGVGTLARLADMTVKSEREVQVMLQGLERVTIGQFIQTQPFLVANAIPKVDREEDEGALETSLSQVVPLFLQLISNAQKMPLEMLKFHLNEKPPLEALYMMAFFLSLDLPSAQALLDIDSPLANLQFLKDYIIQEIEKFEQIRQVVREAENRRLHVATPSQGATDEIESALNALHLADTLSNTWQVLVERQQYLREEAARETLGTHMNKLKEQQVSGYWIFRLEHDLELLENVHNYGIEEAHQRLEQRIILLGNQQDTFEALTLLTSAYVSGDVQALLEGLQQNPFSPGTFDALERLSEKMGEEPGSQVRTILEVLRYVGEHGVEAGFKRFVEKARPGFKQEFEQAQEVLGMYLTSDTLEEAYQTLKEHQNILLSDLVYDMLERCISGVYRAGRDDIAEGLELQLSLLVDARTRGLDAAWQDFIADIDEEDDELGEEDEDLNS
jgi:Lon protease-like protein